MSKGRRKQAVSHPDLKKRGASQPRDTGGLSEERLWAYALGMLDPRERSIVLEIVTESDEAQKELRRIRRAIYASAKKEQPSAARRFASDFLGQLRRLGDEVTVLVTAFIRVQGGLVTAYCQGGWTRLATQGATLGELAVDQPRPEEAARRISLRGPGGLRISAVHLPAGNVDVEVCVASTSAEGWIKIFRLLPSESGGIREEFTGIQGRLSEGRALLCDCPDGFLRLAGPDDMSLDIFLGCAGMGA